MATRNFTIKVPPSTTEQTVNVAVNIPDPIISVPQPVVTQGPPSYTQADATETHTITGTTAPAPVVTSPPPVTPTPTSTPSPRKNLILAVDFTDGKLPTSLTAQPPSRFIIKPINGKNYCEITVAKTDPPIPVGSTNRSEFNVPTSQAEPFKEGAVRWYGVRYNLPKSFIPDAAMELVYQLHEYSGTASPHFALWTMGGHWYTAIGGVRNLDLGAYEFDKDTDFVFKIKWSTTSAGYIEVYKNGQLVKTYPGATMPADTKLPYMKCGIYKWSWIKGPASNPSSIVSRTINIGALYIGNDLATYDDVRP